MLKLRLLSQNTLKIIAAVSMLLDHIGFFLFGGVPIFRMLGRLAFPIFAFFIAEGARYTRCRRGYLVRMICFGVLCQIPAFIFEPRQPLNIFITFALSIIFIYLFDWLKVKKERNEIYIPLIVTVLALALVFIFTRLVVIEYGFIGVMLAPLASIPKTGKSDPLDIPYRILFALPAFIALSFEYIGLYQPLCLLAIPLLLLYSGERGALNLKYLFYIFYPAHIVILYGIMYLIK